MGTRTEFSMVVDEVASSLTDGEDRCDRFGRFDCSNEMWKVPPDLPGAHSTSGAVARGVVYGGTVSGAATWSLLVLAATCRLLLFQGRAGRHASSTRRSSCR